MIPAAGRKMHQRVAQIITGLRAAPMTFDDMAAVADAEYSESVVSLVRALEAAGHAKPVGRRGSALLWRWVEMDMLPSGGERLEKA